MKIAVFGASGRTGRLVVDQALAAGHEVVAFVRDPAKLPLRHERLTLVQGDVTDLDAVRRAVAGVDAVIAALAPRREGPKEAVSRGIANILAAMQEARVRRIVISSGAGVPDPKDPPSFATAVIRWLLRRIARPVIEDAARAVALLRASDRDWTVIRAPFLVDGPRTGRYRLGYFAAGFGARISRADLADALLKAVDDLTLVGSAPIIAS
ncbi:MAG: SDR family oxidoreductase [Chloroflexota bacterium]|nr:SDR family oxidoreductase [Dehalococcoidia bacterium]MDW8253461.1 SDR family oxidoreductase [Chloroflexota bacterium]